MNAIVNSMICIGVVAHKPYEMPADSAYLPIWVGRDEGLPIGFYSHNNGDGIAELNETYCELTGLYWVWKNVKADFKGLAHYRRILSRRPSKDIHQVLNTADYLCAFANADVLLPPKKTYPFATIASHYCNSKKGYEKIHQADLDSFLLALQRVHPSYKGNAQVILNSSKAHLLNIFCMKNELFDDYCTWLFPLMEDFTSLRSDRIDQRRFVGAISEFAVDIWLSQNRVRIQEFNLYEPEASVQNRLLNCMLRRPSHKVLISGHSAYLEK